MLITIIIATYNAGKTLERCLQSIILQKTKDVELIIIDGTSYDDTLEIINKYSQYVDKFISEKDDGIYDAWNKGIAIAKGEWIMFIGADDELLPDALLMYERCLNETKDVKTYDYICAHNDYITSDGRFIKKIGNAPVWQSMRYNMSAAHVGSLHNKKNLFETVGLYNIDYKICGDYELLLRKRDKLKYIFLSDTIAKMMEGGMSMSLKALIETYKIRRTHKTINGLLNCIIFFKSILFYKIYKYHK